MTKTRASEATAFESDGRDVRVQVFAKPKSSRSKVLGVKNGLLEVALGAPPVDGKANEELVNFLAKYFGLPRSRVLVEGGQTARTKRVRLVDFSVEAVLAALNSKPP